MESERDHSPCPFQALESEGALRKPPQVLHQGRRSTRPRGDPGLILFTPELTLTREELSDHNLIGITLFSRQMRLPACLCLYVERALALESFSSMEPMFCIALTVMRCHGAASQGMAAGGRPASGSLICLDREAGAACIATCYLSSRQKSGGNNVSSSPAGPLPDPVLRLEAEPLLGRSRHQPTSANSWGLSCAPCIQLPDFSPL